MMMPKTFTWRPLVACLGIALVSQGHSVAAMGLLQAYDAAVQNDPTFRSAIYENQAGQENKALGLSNLLPNAQFNYSASKDKTELTQPNPYSPGSVVTTNPEYTSTAGSVSVRQVLFSLDAYARYKQGVAQSNYSDAVFSSKRQDLVVRLFSAYADAQYAENQVALLAAQRDAYVEQRHVNDRMFEKGEGTKTDMLETQAKLDLAEAQLLEAQDNLTTARNTLAAIVGKDVIQLDGLSETFRVMPLAPSSINDWQAIATKNNAEILAGQFAVEAADQEVKKNWAGHTPRLDLQAGYSRSKSDTINTLNQEYKTKSLGVQLVIPLYSGGQVSAATRQAVANREKAKADLEITVKKVDVELRKEHSAIFSSAAKIDALVKSVASATELIKATQQSIKAGVRINLDLLNAQQQLMQAKRDLVQARYNYLIAYLRLRNAAGVLNGEDLRAIAGYFVASN
jgi:protease secretion system outer membrane protein